MNRRLSVVATPLLLCLASAGWAQNGSQVDPNAGSSTGVTLSLIERKLTDKCLTLRYEIANRSDRDIWICESMDVWSEWGDVEVHIGKDDQTLFVQRRLDVPMSVWREQPAGRNVRLPRGQTRAEVLSLTLPVRRRQVYASVWGLSRAARATRMVLEIGYYEGNLPATILQRIEEEERNPTQEKATLPAYGIGLAGAMGGTVHFNSFYNRGVRARDEQVVIPWTRQSLKGENVLRMAIDDVSIPCSTEYTQPKRIHVTPCKKIEVRFRGSPLGFYYPYPQEQSLLSEQEKRSVESIKRLETTDYWDIMGIAYVTSTGADSVFYPDHGAADLTCYRKDGSVVSFTVYDSVYVVTPDGQVYRCREELERLRTLSPQVKTLDLRMQCAANLKNLWYYFRLYPILKHASTDSGFWNGRDHAVALAEALKTGEKAYPSPDQWCDAAADQQRVCPSAGEGRCHYAMNPNCRYDSPGDVVLLFETKAGWNQCGGPELFSVDNHDPRGGCVLLNDGTVKFVRTPEELRRLRWQ
jgi:hypothetical protein